MVGAHRVVDECLNIFERKTDGVVGKVIDFCKSGDRGIQFGQSFVQGGGKLDVVELFQRTVDIKIGNTHGVPTKDLWQTIEVGDEGGEIALEPADALGDITPNSP